MVEAQKVLADEHAQQETVDKAEADLRAAKEQLVKIPGETEGELNLEKLQELISKAEKLKEKDYTTDSWKVFAQALEEKSDCKGRRRFPERCG